MAEQSSSDGGVEDDFPASGAPVVDLVELIHAHHAAVYRYAVRLCGCPTDAEDLTQQTFLIAQRKLHQLREPDRAAAWLLAVLRSCFLKSIRKTRPTPAANIDLDVDSVAEQTPPLESDEIDRQQIAAALAELPDEFRLVLLMFYFEGLSYQQIAAQLQVPIGTVMSRLSRAKGHLKKKLSPVTADPVKVAPLRRPTAAASVPAATLRAAP